MFAALFNSKLNHPHGSPKRQNSRSLLRMGSRSRVAEVHPGSQTDADVNPLDLHSKELQKLSSSMRANLVQMRTKFADVEAIKDSLVIDEVKFAVDFDRAQTSNNAYIQFYEEMEGDFELMKHKPQWIAAYDAVLSAALGENKEVPPSTEALAKFICDQLSSAEPEMGPHATAFVGRHPLDSHTLKVFHATEAVQLEDGATLRVREGVETPDIVAGCLSVMASGEAELFNAHGGCSRVSIPRDSYSLPTSWHYLLPADLYWIDHRA